MCKARTPERLKTPAYHGKDWGHIHLFLSYLQWGEGGKMLLGLLRGVSYFKDLETKEYQYTNDRINRCAETDSTLSEGLNEVWMLSVVHSLVLEEVSAQSGRQMFEPSSVTSSPCHLEPVPYLPSLDSIVPKVPVNWNAVSLDFVIVSSLGLSKSHNKGFGWAPGCRVEVHLWENRQWAAFQTRRSFLQGPLNVLSDSLSSAHTWEPSMEELLSRSPPERHHTCRRPHPATSQHHPSLLRSAPWIKETWAQQGARTAAFHFHNQMFMYHFLLPFLLSSPLSFLFEQSVFKHPLLPCWGQKVPVMLV